jgi:hypothetical protein
MRAEGWLLTVGYSSHIISKSATMTVNKMKAISIPTATNGIPQFTKLTSVSDKSQRIEG